MCHKNNVNAINNNNIIFIIILKYKLKINVFNNNIMTYQLKKNVFNTCLVLILLCIYKT